MSLPPNQADQQINIRVALTGTYQMLRDLQNVMGQMNTIITNTAENINVISQALGTVGEKTVRTTKKNLDTISRLGKTLWHDITKVAEWGIATSVIYGITKSLNDMARSGIEVEYALSGLGKVMREGMGRAVEVYKELNKVATAYGVSQIDAIEAATEWARLQENNTRLLEGTRVALLAQSVAEMQVSDATRLLISALKQLEIPTSRVSEVLDSWNELSNTFAVRAEDLAEGIARAGSMAKQAGVDIGTLNGWITALVQATGRSGREMGNALKTMGVYAYRVETLSKLQNVAGISAKNMYGEFKPLPDLFLEIASKWDTYNDAQKHTIATTIAGTRRVNEFIVLMNNYSTALQAAAKSYDSLGSAEREAAIRLNTTKMALARASSGIQAISYNIMKTLAPMIYGFGEFNLHISKIIPLVMSFVSVLSILTTLSSTFRSKIFTLVTAFMPFHKVITLVVLALGALYYAWGKIAMHKRKVQVETENLIQTEYSQYNIHKKQVELLKLLTASYDSLEHRIKTTNSESERNRLLEERLSLEKIISQTLIASGYAVARNLHGEQLITAAKRAQLNLEKNIGSERQKSISALYYQKRIIEGIISGIQNKISRGQDVRYGDLLAAPGLATGYERQVLDRLRYRGIRPLEHRRGEKIPEEQLTQILGKLREEVNVLNSEMEELVGSAREFSNQILEEDLETQYDNLMDSIERVGITYEHYANVMEIAGRKESERIEKQKEGINKQIQMLEEAKVKFESFVASYPEAIRYVEKITDNIRELRTELFKLSYTQKEADISQRVKDINDEYEKNIKTVKSWGDLQESIISHYKGESAAARHRLSVMEKELEITNKTIEVLEKAGGNTQQLKEKKEDLIQEIKIEKQRMEELTEPMERYRDTLSDIGHKYTLLNIEGQITDYSELDRLLRDLNKAQEEYDLALELGSEEEQKAAKQRKEVAEMTYRVALAQHERTTKLDNMNKKIQQETELLTALGLSESQVLEYEKHMVTQLKNMAIELGANEDIIKELDDRIFNLNNRIQALSIQEYFKRMNEELEDWIDAQNRGINVEYAITNDRIAMLKNNIAALEEYKKRIDELPITYEAKMERIREIDRQIADSNAELTIEIISNWRSAVEEFYNTQIQIRDSWRSTIASMMQDVSSGDVVGAFRQLQRKISDTVTDIIVDKAFRGLIEKLANFEITARGVTPERILQERQIQEMQLQTLMNGGNYIRTQMEAAGINVGNYIRGAMQSAAVMPAPTTIGMTPSQPSSGTTSQFSVNTAVYSLMAMQVVSKLKDWTTGRGGGWRAVGYGAGAGIGYYFGGPYGALIGANIGEQIVSAIQSLRRHDTKVRKAEVETLRDQINRALGTGEFREAAQITYNVQNNYNMGFMIPDSQQIRRVIAILKKEEALFNKNISVQ